MKEYGALYRMEPLPDGLAPDELQAYVDQVSWFHEIDLGNGVTTRYASVPRGPILRNWSSFGLGDLTGKTVLDIGAVDGAYSFLAEQAGARRVLALDHYLWAMDKQGYGEIYRKCVDNGEPCPPPHLTDAWDLDSLPNLWCFDTARQALNSRVERLAVDFMECDLDELGTWDVVLYLGVLYHMTDPVGAMSRVARVTGEQAIVETEAIIVPGHADPLWSFFPGHELNGDSTNWWAPNMSALLGLCQVSGFTQVEILVPEPALYPDFTGTHHYRTAIRVIK